MMAYRHGVSRRLLPHSKRRCGIQAVLFYLVSSVFLMLYLFIDDASIAYCTFISRRQDCEQDSSNPSSNSLNLTENHTLTREGYVVWNPSCRIPDIDPWDKSIRNLVKPGSPIICFNKPPLTKLQDDTLILVRDLLNEYSPMTKCCYRQIVRKDAEKFNNGVDDVYNMSVCETLEDSIRLRSDQEFVMVSCHAPKSEKDEEVYTNFHARSPIRQDIKPKLHRNVTPEKQRMSVLIVGLDSISRLNLIRTMPKTVNFLRQTGWVEMRGYNKMAENTFPNLMAILTGLDPTAVRNTCMTTNEVPVDNCPFIWKNFSNEGYITGYGEDAPNWGTFNFLKTGFFKTPTDYYLRPFMLATRKYSKIIQRDYMDACYGPTLSTDHIFQYATDFSKTFRDYLYFGLFWLNALSHNNVNTPFALDNGTLKFLLDISENGVLNNTFVVFLSDHGMRFGKIRETFVGWLEEMLPFIYFWVPKWFRTLNPKMYSNLVHNQNKLISPYDLHLTLQHVLNGKYQNGTFSCPKCMSLFDQVPWNRSCADVGVTETWCACSEYKSLSTEGASVWAIVKFALNEINNLIKNNTAVSNNTKCAELSVSKIITLKSKVDPVKSMLTPSFINKKYIVVFETLPSNAIFEATIRDSGQFELMGTVSRLNMYSSQSECMNDSFLRKYCFCINV